MPAFAASQVDYLVFATLALGAFAVLARLLPRIREGVSMPLIGWWIVAAVLCAGWWPVEQAGRNERLRIESLVGALAPAYAKELARAGHERLALDTPIEDPLSQKILGLLKDWTEANPYVADIYTMRRNAEGKPVFLADADTDYDGDGIISDDEGGAARGEVFEEEDAGLELAFAGQANFNPETVTDRWGSWVGCWQPLWRSDGTLDAVMGIDYHAHVWDEAQAQARMQRIAQVGLFLLTVAVSLAFVGVFHGIAKQRAIAEEAHARAAERLRLTLEQMPLAFTEFEPSGLIIAWNPAAEAMFGYPAREVIGTKHLDIVVAPSARTQVQDLWQSLLAGRSDIRNVNENVTRDGRIIRCEWFNARNCATDGRLLSIICLARDVTEQEQLEEQLRQSQRMTSIGQLAAGIAHDFNNLLTVIQGHAEILRENRALPESMRTDVDRIAAAGSRAADLTRQLLTFSRKQAMFVRPIDLNHAIQAAVHLLERTLGASIHVRCELAPDAPPVQADPSMLDQVLTNLAVNARDAMPKGGTLVFRTLPLDIPPSEARLHPERRAGKFVQLTVADTGEGIPPEILPRIFEPFFTTKEVGQGTGLGLSAVHGIVQQHGGWIEVRSRLREGTVFEVYLPQSTDRAPIPEIKATPRAQPGGGAATVLLVEDEEAVRDLARQTLERNGYEVLEAGDGPAAEELWRAHRFEVDLLLTDLVMPKGLSGRELASRLRAERGDLPVIYASGYSLETSGLDIAGSLTQLFLPKPYRPSDLIAAVEKVLAEARC
jgi:PAS domain S-box-containing protein